MLFVWPVCFMMSSAGVTRAEAAAEREGDLTVFTSPFPWPQRGNRHFPRAAPQRRSAVAKSLISGCDKRVSSEEGKKKVEVKRIVFMQIFVILPQDVNLG